MLRTLVAVAVAAVLAVPAAAYEVTTVADGGTLTGVVKFAGAPPKLPPLAVNKNRDVCGEQKDSEALGVGTGGGVRGSVILIEGAARGKKPAGDVVLDNHRCVFVAHVTAGMPGERVRGKNSDAVLHNTHGFLGKPTVFNLD